MPSDFYAIPTLVGQARIANAIGLGTPLSLTQMAIGDGNGNPVTPAETMTALVREVYRGNVNQVLVDPQNSNVIIAELAVPSDVGNWTMREVGVFDNTGTLIAIGNFPVTFKPISSQGALAQILVRLHIVVEATSAINLTVDPSVVLASRQWVEDQFNQRVSKASVRAASTGGNVTLSGTRTIDGISCGPGTRVLVKDQTNPADNGIYVVASGAWARASDMDSPSEFRYGMLVPVESGTLNGGSVWQYTTIGAISLGTTGISFSNLLNQSVVNALALTQALRLPRVPINGYRLSNHSADTVNDILVTPGVVVGNDGATPITLTSNRIKRLDAAWAAGTNAGGLLTGTKAANTTYHLFALLNPSTGVVDVAFHTTLDPTAVLPSGFTLWARIGSLFTDGSSAWVQFKQSGRRFVLKDPITFTTTTNTTTEQLATVGIPTGLEMEADLFLMLYAVTAGPLDLYVYDPSLPNTVASPDATSLHTGVNAGTCDDGAPRRVMTNTNGQVAYRFSRTGWGTFKINTMGWIDPLEAA